MYDNTSPRYRLSQYRNPEKIQAEVELNLFLSWIKRNSENEPTPEETKKLQDWIDEYLGYTFQQIKDAEQLALEKWCKR